MGPAAIKQFLLRRRFPLSFHQLLWIAFFSILVLLGGALAQALIAVDTLSRDSRGFPSVALHVAESTRELEDVTVSLERESRQFLVLEDPSQRLDIRNSWNQGLAVTQELDHEFPERLQALTERWNQMANEALAPLISTPNVHLVDQKKLFQTFEDLGQLNQSISRTARAALEEKNQLLAQRFEHQRQSLIAMGFSAVVLAGALALLLGSWLSWSFKRLDSAIHQLGQRTPGPMQVTGGPRDMHQLGQRLRWLQRRLATLESNKLLFLRHISHELKTPLGNLREGIALLEDQVTGPINHAQGEILTILRDNALALQHQIEGLLEYNSLSLRPGGLDRRPTDLHALIQRVIDHQRLQSQAKQVTVTLEGSAITARVNPEHMETICSNLLLNAVRFSPRNGLVRLLLEARGKGFRLDVIDQGPGVDPVDRERIFRPFYQGVRQPQGARKGSGVGLSIVQELTSAHGGTVQLQDSPLGAHFRIEMPDEIA